MKKTATIARVLAPVFSLSLLAGYVIWSHQSAQVSAADMAVEETVPVPWEVPPPRSHVLQQTLAEKLELNGLGVVLVPQTDAPFEPVFREPAWLGTVKTLPAHGAAGDGFALPGLAREKIRLKSTRPPPLMLMSSSKSGQVFAEPVAGTLWHSAVAIMMADAPGSVSDEVSPQKLQQRRIEQRILRPQYDMLMRSSKSGALVSPQMIQNFGRWKNVWHPLTELLLPVHSNTPAQGSGSVLQPAP